jgi:hypothetical protein
MNAKSYAVLSHAIELGLAYGLRRLFKHRESPVMDVNELTSEVSLNAVHDAVMTEICEWFSFEEHE